MRRKKKQAAEDEYKRSNQVSDFMRGGGERKPPQTGYSQMSDSRLDPEAGQRRDSQGSIADNQDYSRRILRVSMTTSLMLDAPRVGRLTFPRWRIPTATSSLPPARYSPRLPHKQNDNSSITRAIQPPSERYHDTRLHHEPSILRRRQPRAL